VRSARIALHCRGLTYKAPRTIGLKSSVLSDFWAMGGYGAFVWSAFGLSLGALLTLFVVSWLSARRRAAELERWRRRLEGAEQS